MKTWAKWTAMIGAVTVGGTATAAVVGAYRWRRVTAGSIRRLQTDALPRGTAAVGHEELNALPAPVRRYFRFTLTPGQSLVRHAVIRHEGTLRTGRDAPWAPFTSVQHFRAGPPGFVWDARLRMGFLPVRIRDSYFGGAGAMRGAVASILPVVDAGGTPEIASGSLHRYLAEAVWLPTALLPSEGVRWEAVSDTSARATLTDAGVTVTLEFTFDADGRIVRFYTPSRFRDVGGTAVLTPWAGRLWNYERIDGMMIPMAADVEWLLPDGSLTVWRGRVLDVAYQFASRPYTHGHAAPGATWS